MININSPFNLQLGHGFRPETQTSYARIYMYALSIVQNLARSCKTSSITHINRSSNPKQHKQLADGGQFVGQSPLIPINIYIIYLRLADRHKYSQEEKKSKGCCCCCCIEELFIALQSSFTRRFFFPLALNVARQ